MLDFDSFSMIGLTAVAIYCIVQAVRDFRAKRYAWGTAAALAAAVLMLMPVQTHAIKVDLPHAVRR